MSNAVYVSIQIAAVTILSLIIIFLVSGAFSAGPAIGVRSACGVALPAIAIVALLAFNDDILHFLQRVPDFVAFLAMALVGHAAMALLVNMANSSEAPLPEIVVSTMLSVTCSTWIAADGDQSALFYSLGTLVGILLYVVLRGFRAANQTQRS